VVAPDGTIYVSDTGNNRIRVIRNGTVAPLAGDLSGPDGQGFADGQGSAAQFAQPMGIALQANGNLLVADSWNLRIREVTPLGLVSTWTGSGALGLENDAGVHATLQYPMAIAVTPGGDALFIEPDTGWLRKVAGTVPHTTSQVAGQLFVEGWEDGPASDATMYHNVAIAVRPSDGQILLADSASARIRALRNGTVDTLAGGMRGGTVDGRGDQAGFGSPRGIAIAPDGSAYVIDTKEHALRRIVGF
jgi:DNA-binding beta-propeller fold protein YncE